MVISNDGKDLFLSLLSVNLGCSTWFIKGTGSSICSKLSLSKERIAI